MIRRDYILRMIEEFRRALAAISGYREARQWEAMEGALDQQFQALLGLSADRAGQLSEIELLARLMQGEATQFLAQKVHLAVSLFKESAEAALAQDRLEEGRNLYLRALHLLLGAGAQTEADLRPDYLPKVDALVQSLAGHPLPARTSVLLMQHFEQMKAFGKAEDALFDLLEHDPQNPALVQFGLEFYERLRGETDASLAAGNLPRQELESGAAELRERRAGSSQREPG